MPREFSRPQRVADFLRRELANLIQFEMRDPRIGMVSISEVEVSRDLNYAKYFSEGEEEISQLDDYTSHNTNQLNYKQKKQIHLHQIVSKKLSNCSVEKMSK